MVQDYINHIAPYHYRSGCMAGRRSGNLHTDRLGRARVQPALSLALSSYRTTLISATRKCRQFKPFIEMSRFSKVACARPSRVRRAIAPGHIGLFDTPSHLMRTEAGGLHMARTAQLASLNDYREAFSFPRVTQFEQISSDPLIVEGLRNVSGRVDNIELYIGLFAEDSRPDSILAQLMGRMVGVDAFSQALTSPLLAEVVSIRKRPSPSWESR